MCRARLLGGKAHLFDLLGANSGKLKQQFSMIVLCRAYSLGDKTLLFELLGAQSEQQK